MSATAENLIRDLAGRGVRLTAHGDRLRVEAPAGTLTPELREMLAGAKPAILAALAGGIREHLLTLAGAEGIAPDLIHALDGADVEACAGLADETLRAYVRALADADLRERGQRPADETAPALCRACGPVWLAPEVASAAPIVAGWPRVLGCPWCHVRNRDAIPRPLVTCAECRHFIRDSVNPAAGMGTCTATREPMPSEAPTYPRASRYCAEFRPEVTP